MPRHPMRISLAIVLLLANSLSMFDVLAGPAQEAERVVAIAPPPTPLRPEAQSRDIRCRVGSYSAGRIAASYARLCDVLVRVWKHVCVGPGCQYRGRREAVSMGEEPTRRP